MVTRAPALLMTMAVLLWSCEGAEWQGFNRAGDRATMEKAASAAQECGFPKARVRTLEWRKDAFNTSIEVIYPKDADADSSYECLYAWLDKHPELTTVEYITPR